MVKLKKKKKIDFVSGDYQIEVIIDKIKMNKSLYERILNTLLLLGNFDKNINLARTEQTYNFKFGRLITNNINFYNMFLGNNVCYHINLVDSSININATNLLNELNKLENIPTFKDYIEIFNKQLIENNTAIKVFI